MLFLVKLLCGNLLFLFLKSCCRIGCCGLRILYGVVNLLFWVIIKERFLSDVENELF